MKAPVAGPTLVLVLLLSTSAPRAEDGGVSTPQAKPEIHDTIAGSVNNAGLQNTLDLSWNWKLSSSPSPLRRDAHVTLGLSHSVTPSYMRLGAWAEIAPLSILEIRVGIEPTAYFGTFNSLMSFDTYSDAFDNDSRDARSDRAGFGTAGRVYVSPTLKMKVGPLAMVGSADFEWWRPSASGPLFYEPARDTLLSTKQGRLLNTSGLLLYQREGETGTLSAGLLHQLTYVYDAPANRKQRLGALVTREFKGKRLHLKHPTFIGNVSYYLNDPFKRHQLSAALAVAFDIAH